MLYFPGQGAYLPLRGTGLSIVSPVLLTEPFPVPCGDLELEPSDHQ